VDARGDWAIVRGGEDWGQYLNGLRMLFWYNSYTRPDPYALERIEVMRGPSSVLFGQSGFGGVINLVSKRPLSRHHREIQVQLGSFNRKQGAIDLTGPIDKDQKWLYRFVGVGRDSNTQIKHVPNDRLMFAPSLTWRPQAQTSFTLLTNLQQDRSGSTIGFFPWRGTLFDRPLGQIPTDTFISEPGFDEYRTDQSSIGYLFQHQFSSRWTVRQNFNYTQGNSSYQSIYTAFDPVPVFKEDDRTVNRDLYISKQNARSPVVDTQAEGRFRTGFLRHTVLSGFDCQASSVNQRMASASAPPIDVFNPQYGNFTVPPLTLTPEQRQNQKGVYAQDHINIGERWSATLGIRKDWSRSATEGDPASINEDGAVTGRAGVVYSMGAGLAPYVNYSQSFQPFAGMDVFNRPYDPIRGKQLEIGAKYQPGSGDHQITTALFDIREQNRLTPDPQNPLNQIQVGEARVRGLEVEARTKLRDVNLLANYSFLDARISESNGPDRGRRLPAVPRHISSLWGIKSFRVDGLSGLLSAGGGIRYNGHSFGGDDVLRTPAYTLYDLMFAYDPGNWRLSINVANLTDKTYLASCLARGDCFFGIRRTITGTIQYRF
jgi:iron complex outermembrane receptor protein